MKKSLLFCSFLGALSGCYQETDIAPGSSSPAASVAGLYRTNFYLDPSSVDTPPNRMANTELRAESDSTVTLTYTRPYPTKTTQSIPHIVVRQQPDGFQLQLGNSMIGTLRTDRIFTNNGMEKQGQLLRLILPIDSINTLIFSGIK